MICKNCGEYTKDDISIIRDGVILHGCSLCIDNGLQRPNDLSANHSRNAQRTEYRADIIQPNQSRDFARLYPKEARERFGDDMYRKLS